MQKAPPLNPYVGFRNFLLGNMGNYAHKLFQQQQQPQTKNKKKPHETSMLNFVSIIHSDESEGAFAGFEGLIIPGIIRNDDDGKDRIVGTQSQVVSANKMLVDLLDRKSSDPPFNISGDNFMGTKRKIDANANATMDDPIIKRPNTLDSSLIASTSASASGTTSSNAANLYAKLAASLLEDEDMELDETVPTSVPAPNVVQSQTIVPSSSSATMPEPKPVITVPMQRQIIVSPNNPTQMILAPGGTNQTMGQPTTATIKTDSGYQTVILQQPNQVGNIQIQKQMIQPVIQQQQTQYVLATNQQGQTYLVAQPQPPPVNQILLQTSQQQGGTPTKTIIILQQQTPNNQPSNQHQILGAVNSAGAPQKVIMTTQQGQQMIVTQG